MGPWLVISLALLILPLTRRCVWLTGGQRIAVIQVALLLLCTNSPVKAAVTVLSTTPGPGQPSTWSRSHLCDVLASCDCEKLLDHGQLST